MVEWLHWWTEEGQLMSSTCICARPFDRILHHILISKLERYGFFFLPFLKMGVIFPFFQSPGTSHDCHDFSNICVCVIVNLLLTSHLQVLVQTTFSPCLSLCWFLSCLWLSVHVILSSLVLSFHFCFHLCASPPTFSL